MAIRKAHRDFIQAVDYEQNARDLNDAAKEAGIVADVVIDVAVGTRSGIPAGEGALALAQVIDKLPNLKLRGMLSYDGGVQHAKGFENRKARALKTIEPNVADVRGDEEGRPQHGDLQRRRKRHLQHHAPGARTSPTCRSAAICSWTCSTSPIGSEDGRRGLHRLRAVAHGDRRRC